MILSLAVVLASSQFSFPAEPISVELEYLNTTSGLQTGYVLITCDLQARCTVSDRTDVGLPGGMPGKPVPTASMPPSRSIPTRVA